MSGATVQTPPVRSQEQWERDVAASDKRSKDRRHKQVTRLRRRNFAVSVLILAVFAAAIVLLILGII